MEQIVDGCCATRVIFLSVLCCVAYNRGRRFVCASLSPSFRLQSNARRDGVERGLGANSERHAGGCQGMG